MYELELNMPLSSPLDCALAQPSHCQSYVQQVKKKVLMCHPVGVVRMPACTETLTYVHSSVPSGAKTGALNGMNSQVHSRPEVLRFYDCVRNT